MQTEMSDEERSDRIRNLLEPQSQTSCSAEFLDSALVTPMTSWKPTKSTAQFDGGVFYNNGKPCVRSQHIKMGAENLSIHPGEGDYPILNGTYVFGGLLKNEHFGHFLAESLARLWILASLGSKEKHVLYYPRFRDDRVPKFATDLLTLIDPDATMTVMTHPCVVERLIVPDQIAHPRIGFVSGHPEMRRVLKPLHQIRGNGPKKIYVSRSKLKKEGGLILEELLEINLERAGYTVVHPQEMSIEEQIRTYNDADFLIFAEGSALHLYALVCRPDQNVFIVRRRHNVIVFDWQIASFGSQIRKSTSCIKQMWLPSGSDAVTHAQAELDFSALRDALELEGMVSGKDWDVPTQAAVSEAIERHENIFGAKFSTEASQ